MRVRLVKTRRYAMGFTKLTCMLVVHNRGQFGTQRINELLKRTWQNSIAIVASSQQLSHYRSRTGTIVPKWVR